MGATTECLGVKDSDSIKWKQLKIWRRKGRIMGRNIFCKQEWSEYVRAKSSPVVSEEADNGYVCK